MKKTYIQPATTMTKVAIQQMICTSTPGVGLSTNVEDAVDAGDVESRTFSVFDDDDE